MPAVHLASMVNDTGRMNISFADNGMHRLECAPTDRKHGPLFCDTHYSLEFIHAVFAQSGAGWTCDEILRDTDVNDAALDIELSVSAYFDHSIWTKPLRILDYGCGGGSSTAVLARLFPNAKIVAADMDAGLLNTARLRQQHYGYDAQIIEVPQSGELPEKDFDLVFLNAVFEHLLPAERDPVMRSVLTALKPTGALILNQTPHRWFPVESHTIGTSWFMNYMSDALACDLANVKDGRTSNWSTWLRRGIRGGTLTEILKLAQHVDTSFELKKPIQHARTWAGIWYIAKERRTNSWIMRAAIRTIGTIIDRLRLPVSPYISVVVHRGAIAGPGNFLGEK